jgi:2'-5' RNA ligase
MKKKRIFIAINLPENIRKNLADYQKNWSELPAKWTKQENIHITLVFLGYVSDEEIPDIYKVVEEVASKYSPFYINLFKISYGPLDKKPPRMIWALGQESKELSSLKENLDQGLGVSENRGFRPHLTLARIRKWDWQRIEPEERPEIDQDINLSFSVNSIEIMESVLKRTGPEYRELSSLNLD